MVKVLFFAYAEFADFEIAHTIFLLKKLGKAEITTASRQRSRRIGIKIL